MDIQDLYHELIIDHGTEPRNYRSLNDAQELEGYNPLCGDKVKIFLKIDNDRIHEISFQGKGCAISIASASLMTELLTGKTLTEASTLFEEFQQLMICEKPFPIELGKLAALSGVRTYPARVKCATLAWHTLHGILKHKACLTE
jgi:nitrogen fixation NifU-like protein